jgi:anti-sigma regulatory factor (Ser/Thr protein kinase)
VTIEQLAISVTPDAQSVAAVRHFVDFARRVLNCPVDADVLAVLTSELVANAVTAADATVTVSVTEVDDRLRVEVLDHGFGLPELQYPRPFDAGGGRGLLIVDDLADAWGVQQFLPGKIVWFELGPASASAGRGNMPG